MREIENNYQDYEIKPNYTANWNGINIPVKREILSGWTKNKTQLCCL